MRRLEVRAEGDRCAVFSPDGELLASGDPGNTIQLWDPTTGTRLKVLGAHQRHLETLSFSPGGKRLATASDDNVVRVWRADAGERERTFSGHAMPVLRAVFSPDNQTIRSCGYSWEEEKPGHDKSVGELR
jgi:WD40 repeat protein